MSVRLRASIVVEYDADPRDYESYEPAEMAAIDQKNWREYPLGLFSSFDDKQFVISVAPAEIASPVADQESGT